MKNKMTMMGFMMGLALSLGFHQAQAAPERMLSWVEIQALKSNPEVAQSLYQWTTRFAGKAAAMQKSADARLTARQQTILLQDLAEIQGAVNKLSASASDSVSTQILAPYQAKLTQMSREISHGNAVQPARQTAQLRRELLENGLAARQ